ncbi:hypothetical protein ACHAPX_006496 [Trichoderma viride]
MNDFRVEQGPENLYSQELTDYVDQSIKDEELFHYFGFEYLHRLNIVSLQNQLITLRESIAAGTHNRDQDLDRLKRLLSDYTNAVRNYNYVRQGQRISPYETETRKMRLKSKFPSMVLRHRKTRPFESHYYYLQDGNSDSKVEFFRDFLRRHLPRRWTYNKEERQHRLQEYQQGKLPLQISKTVDKTVRLGVSLLAVASLVAPMCIMILNPSMTKSLITSSLFMVAFAVGISFGMKTSNSETLVATATYSAVLVVFVGTNSGSSSGAS